MRNSTLYIIILICNFSIAQDITTDDFDIDWHIENKTSDFNTVFAPLFHQKDTFMYRALYEKSKKEEYDLGQIIALNLLGTYYRDQSEYAKSIELHNEALGFSRDKKILDGILYSNNMLGVVYRRMDDVQKGLKYHFTALELAEQSNQNSDFIIRNKAIAVNGIGNAYLILQEYESARRQFNRSYQIEMSIENHLGMAINHQNIGYTFEKTNQLDSAQHHYFASLAKNEFIQSNIGKMICYNSIGRVLSLQENYQNALEYFDLAEVIAEDLGDSFYTANIYYEKGLALLLLGEKENAEQYLNRSLDLSIQHNLKSNQADSYNALALYNEQIGNYELALDLVRKSKEVESNFLNENNLRIKNNLEISYEVDSKANQILNLEKEKDEIIAMVSQKQQTILYLVVLFAVLIIASVLFFQRDKLRKEKQLLELEQKVLRAQMNPHFTFNALNSIKTYIISQNTTEAVKYLNKFAKLIRGVLHSSDKKVITLEEELETIESYLSIERLRFQDPIKFEVEINDVDPASLEVPPLLLQPFIENALWHGLAPKKGEKMIRIHVFEIDQNWICIDIIDNGIGREASQKDSAISGHKSLGVSISRKRLNNHFNLKNDKSSLSFTDLKDENNIALGTKVSILIPNQNPLSGH